jgi:hypothetical protein
VHENEAWSRPRKSGPDDRGLSLVVTAISLLVTALLALLVLKATGVSGSGTPAAPSQSVSLADATQAQQNLTQGVSALQQTDAGGQGSVDAPALQSADPSVTFTSGASSSPSTISVTPQSDGSSVVLADRSSDGNCWVVWWSPTASTWFGVQTGQASCTAPNLPGTPASAAPSSSTIGWQQGSFPAA